MIRDLFWYGLIVVVFGIPFAIYHKISKRSKVKLRGNKMEKIWIECTCDYEGYAEMIKPDGWEYEHPFCPECGALIENIVELSKDEWKKKTK